MSANPRKEARRKAGFRTQTAFAEAIGWHKSSVANIECGQREPPEWYDLLVGLIIENKELKDRLDVVQSS